MQEANEEMVNCLARGSNIRGLSRRPVRDNGGRVGPNRSNTVFYFSTRHNQVDGIFVSAVTNPIMERI
jgi:hypothetical protein